MRLDPGSHSSLLDRLPCPPAPQIPRSDLPHGGRSRPDTTLLRMNHCLPWTRMRPSPSRRLFGPGPGAQQRSFVEGAGQQPTTDTNQLSVCAAGLAPKSSRGGCYLGCLTEEWEGATGTGAYIHTSPIPSQQAWKGEWTKAHA